MTSDRGTYSAYALYLDSGEQDDFKRHVLSELDVLFEVAQRIVLNTEQAEGIVYRAVLASFRGWPARPTDVRTKAWLLRLLWEESMTEHEESPTGSEPSLPPNIYWEVNRAGSGDTQLPTSDEGFFDMLNGSDVARVRDGLPFADRVVLALNEAAGLRYAEISYVLGTSTDEGRARLHGAREVLKARLLHTALQGGYWSRAKLPAG